MLSLFAGLLKCLLHYIIIDKLTTELPIVVNEFLLILPNQHIMLCFNLNYLWSSPICLEKMPSMRTANAKNTAMMALPYKFTLVWQYVVPNI
jgi:hypothetical protein